MLYACGACVLCLLCVYVCRISVCLRGAYVVWVVSGLYVFVCVVGASCVLCA